ncbi:MAG TPA: c-type cytochrome [Pirellulales bacterium]|nr:c-type cytochrome [Pirellulales bacterium]
MSVVRANERREQAWRAAIGPALCVLLALCALLATGCNGGDWPGKPDPDSRPVPADKITDFAVLYQTYCAGCHGADGRLGPAPPLNDPIFLAIVQPGDLLDVIQGGRRGTLMPAFSRERGGVLTDEQIAALAVGIKPYWSGRPKAENEQALPADLPRYAAGASETAGATDAAERGKELFGTACAKCHGKEGKDGGAGSINDADFLALISNQALRRIIITGRPDLGMPNFSEKTARGEDFHPLSSGDIDDLVALLAEWRTAGGQAAPTTAGQSLQLPRYKTEVMRETANRLGGGK